MLYDTYNNMMIIIQLIYSRETGKGVGVHSSISSQIRHHNNNRMSIIIESRQTMIHTKPPGGWADNVAGCTLASHYYVFQDL